MLPFPRCFSFGPSPREHESLSSVYLRNKYLLMGCLVLCEFLRSHALLTYWGRFLKYVSQINSGIIPQECTTRQIKLSWGKEHFRSLCNLFFNCTEIIFTAASAGIYQPPYNLPPYVLSCLLKKHITYQLGVFFFSCRITSPSLKVVRNFFCFTKTVKIIKTGRYSHCANNNEEKDFFLC